MQSMRWGILGTGNIARQFTSGLRSARLGHASVVASRQQGSADVFARSQQVPTAVGDYQALLDRDDVDVVYNALPNTLHHEWTIRALRAGKHVLCEKPLASNLAEAQEMFDVARDHGLVLAEAFMYRSHPQTLAVQSLLSSGAIGQLRMIRSSFCYRTTRIDGNVRFDPALAGGALMDIGCYCVSLSRLLTGAEPLAVHAGGHFHPSGVDELVAAVMVFPDGVIASFTCGMCLQVDNTAYIAGSDGYIEVPVPWKPPRSAVHHLARGTPPKMDQTKPAAPGTGSAAAPVAPPPRQTFTIDTDTDLYAIEADDFVEAIQTGRPQRVSVDDSLGNMRVLDELRRQLELARGIAGEARS